MLQASAEAVPRNLPVRLGPASLATRDRLPGRFRLTSTAPLMLLSPHSLPLRSNAAPEVAAWQIER